MSRRRPRIRGLCRAALVPALVVAASIGPVAASIGPVAASTAPVAARGAPAARGGGGIGAQPVLLGLDDPAAFTLAPDGRIFYGEHTTGRIRLYDPASGTTSTFATVSNLSTDGDQGVLGIALHPAYPGRPLVYVYASRLVGGVERNQIVRYTDLGGTGTGPRVIFTEDVVANGLVFCQACGLPGSEGELFFGAFNNGRIERVVLTADRRHIASISVAYRTGTPAGVLSMERGPDGTLYFSDTGAIYRLVAT